MHFPAARFDGVFRLDVRIEFANDIVATSNGILLFDNGGNLTRTLQFSFQLPPTLPFIKGNSEEHFPRNKYLFQSFPSQRIETEITELYIKITVIRNLIKEYGTLSEKEQEKVEAIHEYLVKFDLDR